MSDNTITENTAPLDSPTDEVVDVTEPPVANDEGAKPEEATPKRKRGRPAGSGDKRPRARKEKDGAPSQQKPKAKASPLAGVVDGDAPMREPGRAGPRIKSAEDLFALPAAELSAMATSMLNMVVVSQVAKRAGAAAANEAMLTTGEQEKIEKATTRVLEKYLPHLSCEWALCLTVAIIYTNKWSNIKLAAAGITQEQAFEMARQHAEQLRQQADAQEAARQGAAAQ